MDKIIVLQIRFSGDDDTVYLCKTHEIAERIIRVWFEEYCTDNPTLEELDEYLWERDLGYWQINEKVVICE